ncbi:MAG: hypothetical protein R3D28_23630 [Geminicoccaceae bacterium]|jgi:hypothetical protein|nr:hypothetical protein [Geminicoccaceae bacterium]
MDTASATPIDVAARLAGPVRRLTVEALAGDWFMGHVRLTVEGASAQSPSQLAGRVRGALGAALRGSASAEALAGRPCPWRPPCALDLLFRSQGRITPALEIPKPMVLALRREGHLLHADLGLVGFASECLEEVAAALVYAWRDRIPDVRGSRIVDRAIGSTAGVAVPASARAVVLAFDSPLEIRWRDAGPASASAALWSLLSSLGNRVSGLARWQDAGIQADWPELRARAATLEMTCLANDSERWQRRSFRQDRRIPMQGDRPVVRLASDLAPFLPWLALGAVTHVGSHAALGMGRYRLLVEDAADTG